MQHCHDCQVRHTACHTAAHCAKATQAASATTSGHAQTLMRVASQEGLPYASLPGRQNPRRHEAGGSKAGSTYLAPLHSRDKRWYIHAW